MADSEIKASEPMTPLRRFRESVFVFCFVQVVGFFVVSAVDTARDGSHFKPFALGFMFATAVTVVSGYLSVRRAWSGQPSADMRDGIIPAAVILALGWAMWTGVHYLESAP